MSEYRVTFTKRDKSHTDVTRVTAESMVEAAQKAEALLTTGAREDGWFLLSVAVVTEA